MYKYRTLIVATCIGLIIGAVSVFVYRPSQPTSVEKESSLTKVAANSISPMQIQVSIDQGNVLTNIHKHLWGINYDQFSAIDSLGKFRNIIQQTSASRVSNDDQGRVQLKSSAGFRTQMDKLSDGKFAEKNISLLRFPGGCGSDSYNSVTGTITLKDRKTKQFYDAPGLSLDELIAQSKGKFDLVYTINMDIYGTWNPCSSLTEYETFPFPLHQSPEATTPISESFRAKLKERLILDAQNIVRKYGKDIAYFELGNEYWRPISNHNREYIELAIDFARAMKSVDPTVKLIVQTGPFTVPMDPWHGGMKDAFVEKDAMNIQCRQGSSNSTVPCFDFAQVHWYSYNRLFDSEHVPRPLEGSSPSIDSVGRLGFSPLFDLPNKWPSHNVNGKLLPIAPTEWNIIHGTTSESLDSVSNMDSAFFFHETLFEYIKREVRISVFHNTNLMQYNNAVKYTFFLTTILQDGNFLNTTSSGVPSVQVCYPDCNNKNTFPLVTTYAGRSSEGELYVFIANHSDEKAAVLNFSGIDGYNAAEAVTIYTNDGYGNEKGSTILTKTEQLTSLRDVKVAPVSITRLQLKKGAAQPQSPLTCNINILNQNIRPQNLSGVPPKFTMNKSALNKGPQLSNTVNDIKLDTAPPSSNTQYAMSLHIRTTNAGDWWDRITPENVFKERANAIGTTHAAYLQNLEPGTYEIACNAILLNAEGKETATACSGAVPERQVTDGPNNARYTKCEGTSLIQLEITTPTPNEQPPSVPPTTAPAANPLTPTLTGVPSATLPSSFTIKEHLFVQMPSENNAKPIYRDYKNFTLMLQNQDGEGQKVFCTKNLDTQEFEPKEKVPGLSCTQAHQVMLENPVTREQKLYHQFTIHMSLNPFNETLYKQWERYRFYWGVGMDPEEAQKAIKAANYPRSINSTDLAQGYHEEKILIQE